MAVIDGGVMSMLMPLNVVEALLPARSVATPVSDCLAPSLASVFGAGQEAIPDSASEQVNATVTGDRYQVMPEAVWVGGCVAAAVAYGSTAALIVGGVVSRLTV